MQDSLFSECQHHVIPLERRVSQLVSKDWRILLMLEPISKEKSDVIQLIRSGLVLPENVN